MTKTNRANSLKQPNKVGTLFDPELGSFLAHVLRKHDVPADKLDAIRTEIMERCGERGLYTTMQNRIKLVLDSIFGALVFLEHKKKGIYPILRRMLLLPQKPIAFTILTFENNALSPIYYSMQDPLFRDDYEGEVGTLIDRINNSNRPNFTAIRGGQLIRIPGTSFLFCLYSIRMQDDGKPSFELLSRQESARSSNEWSPFTLISMLMSRLKGSQAASNTITGDLENTIIGDFKGRFRELNSSWKFQATTPVDINKLSKKDVAYKEYLVELIKNKVLYPIYQEVKSSPLIRSKPGAVNAAPAPFANLFFMLRSCSKTEKRYGDTYDYGVRILMPKAHQDEVNKHFVKMSKCPLKSAHNDQDCPLSKADTQKPENRACVFKRSDMKSQIGKLIGREFGNNSRSFCDPAFNSGLVDFSSEIVANARGKVINYDEKTLPEDKELQFFKSTACLFWQLTQEPRVMVVPIVVGGTPWLSCFTITRAEDQPTTRPCSFLSSYQFYRMLISRVITRKVRALSRNLYLEEAGRIFTELLVGERTKRNGWSSHIKTANKALKLLAMVFPFDQLEFSPDEECKKDGFKAGESWGMIKHLPETAILSVYKSANNYFPRLLGGHEYLSINSVIAYLEVPSLFRLPTSGFHATSFSSC